MPRQDEGLVDVDGGKFAQLPPVRWRRRIRHLLLTTSVRLLAILGIFAGPDKKHRGRRIDPGTELIVHDNKTGRDFRRIAHNSEYNLSESVGDPDADKVRKNHDDNCDPDVLQDRTQRRLVLCPCQQVTERGDDRQAPGDRRDYGRTEWQQ